MIVYIIPTLNEQGTIIGLVSEILNFSDNNMVLVIDDGSVDGTVEICKNHFLNNEKVKFLTNPSSKGLGASLKYGISKAFEYQPAAVITMDGDGSHDPSVLGSFFKYPEYDLVIGSRYIEGGIHNLPLPRLWLSKIGNTISRKILRVNLTDTTSGYRYYKTSGLKNVDMNLIKSNDYNFQIEILHSLLQNKANVKEIPIIFGVRKSGQSKFTLKQVLLSSQLLLRLLFKSSHEK